MLRNGCSARSLSVVYCRWGSRKVLLTFSTEMAVGVVDTVAAGIAAGRVVVVGKGQRTLAIAWTLSRRCFRAAAVVAQTRCRT